MNFPTSKHIILFDFFFKWSPRTLLLQDYFFFPQKAFFDITQLCPKTVVNYDILHLSYRRDVSYLYPKHALKLWQWVNKSEFRVIIQE